MLLPNELHQTQIDAGTSVFCALGMFRIKNNTVSASNIGHRSDLRPGDLLARQWHSWYAAVTSTQEGTGLILGNQCSSCYNILTAPTLPHLPSQSWPSLWAAQSHWRAPRPPRGRPCRRAAHFPAPPPDQGHGWQPSGDPWHPPRNRATQPAGE